jgi:hypothetical protein
MRTCKRSHASGTHREGRWFKAHDLDALKEFRSEGEPSVGIRLMKQD